MVELVWKVRVALLWVFLGVAQLMGMALFIYRPGSLRQIARGDAAPVAGGDPGTDWGLIQGALAVLLPLAMAFLTLVLGERVNRWANGALGLLWAVTAFFLMLQQLGDVADFVVSALFFVVTVVVLWHVWAWPTHRRSPSVTHQDRGVGQHHVRAGRS